jgi:hypothetical protein
MFKHHLPISISNLGKKPTNPAFQIDSSHNSVSRNLPFFPEFLTNP